MLSETMSRFAGKALCLFLLAIMFLIANANAQVYNGNIILTSQAQVDNFNYESVNGDLTIFGGDITNLSGLSGLSSVAGILSIENNPSLSNLNGLSALQSVQENLLIQGNDVLTNINGINSNVRVGVDLPVDGRIMIAENAALASIDAFPGFATFRELVISQNNSLANIDGLSSLAHIEILLISNNNSLTNIDGLSNLNSTWQGFNILGNDALTNMLLV